MASDKQYGGIVAALVVPRSRSGKTLQELESGAPPVDLKPYQPTSKTMQAVRQAFERMGFQLYDEPLGLTLTIEGPASLFVSVFRVSDKELIGRGDLKLPVPAPLKRLVYSISLIPPAKFS